VHGSVPPAVDAGRWNKPLRFDTHPQRREERLGAPQGEAERAHMATFNELELETAVRRRYSEAALQREADRCCPVVYNRAYLEVIPAKVLARDYGCGDPSRRLRPGETVLDLGSGTGKTCFIASQVVGREGRVIGIDMNDGMLALARRSAPAVAERIGYGNVTFGKGRIQDLALDLERLETYLASEPVRTLDHLAHLEGAGYRLTSEAAGPACPAEGECC
jgi:arsenite methyltransferase